MTGSAPGYSLFNTWLQHSQRNIKYQTNVADLVASKILKYRYQIEQFVVMGVREPAADWNGVLWVENVRRGRVIDDNGVL